MGVPALFRWLSKKYPRIVASVEEEEPRKVPGADGEDEELPIDMSGPNPGGEENDCLYLDMNGIVHPCTHPEGKPAPETEEDMMVEIFSYTERVVNMVRPRKLLMMAIDGVAPRAKMNQQRSRRFRSAQEAQEKHEEQLAALAEWKSMGLPVTDEAMAVKKAWDSNAITPGTPFMFLLAASLRYWVTKKLNTDPGWKDLKVIISDASVPGEGEHKIMDYIRRQRSHPSHDPNTRHVIYGLDADLIMLSLATHEPYFKVLREDVFAQDSKSNACHRCGGQGHIAANCIGEPKAKKGPQDAGGEKTVSEKKPFIYLDVSILREYLEVELDVPNLPFGFDLERALDDWVFLIFFVGNDFLPHLPSLEIREGAIDQLLTIWKAELPRSGGYLTNHGRVEMKHAQVILEGLAAHEDDIFRRRKEQEERQEANQKRRKDEEERRQRRARGERETPPERDSGPAALEDGLVPVIQPASAPASLSKEEAMKKMLEPVTPKDAAAARKANLSAAAKLRAELAGKNGIASDPQVEEVKKVADGGAKVEAQESNAIVEDGDEVKPAESNRHTNGADAIIEDDVKPATNGQPATELEAALFPTDEELEKDVVSGRKRTHDEAEAEDAVIAEDVDDTIGAAEDEDEGNETVDPVLTKTRTVKADGTVEYEDTVKLWEPGYRERYYRQKFGVELSDVEFRRKVVKAYVEGLCWVLAYYYQGCPSWTWYYPYHYSPFAADFTELEALDITFEVGTPFKPFEQLMGVFPAASRVHVPEIFHPLMIEPDSEIIEYYPTEFEIDMNGKKMAWQGVALLPFIDEKRLLKAVAPHYPSLDEEQTKRNTFGSDALFVSEKSSLYDHLCALYAKRKNTEPIAIDPKLSNGMTGWVRPDPDCVPGSTFASPLTSVQLADIRNDRALSVLYDVPEQTTPHRSVLLKGLKPPPRKLTEGDKDWTRRGGPDSRGRGRGRGRGGHGPGVTHAGMRMGSGPMNGGGGGYQNGGGSRGAYDFGASHNAYSSSAPSSYQQYGGPPQHSRPYEQTSYGAGGGYGQQAPPYQQPAYTGGSMSAYGNGGGAYQGGRDGGQYGGPPSGGHGGSYGGGQGAYGGGGYGSSAYGNQPPSANGGGYSYGGAYGSGAGAYGGAAQGAYGGAGGGAYGSYGGQQGYQQPYGGGGYGGGSYGGRQSGPPPPLGRGGAQPPRGGGRY